MKRLRRFCRVGLSAGLSSVTATRLNSETALPFSLRERGFVVLLSFVTTSWLSYETATPFELGW